MKTGANKREHRKTFVTPKLTCYGTLEEITMQTQPSIKTGFSTASGSLWDGDGDGMHDDDGV